MFKLFTSKRIWFVLSFISIVAILFSITSKTTQFPSQVDVVNQEPSIFTTPVSTSTPSPVSQLVTQPQIIDLPIEPIHAQIVIEFAPNSTAEERSAYIESVGGTVVESIEALDTVIVTVSEEVAQEPMPLSAVVAKTEPDYFVAALDDLAPVNDPRYVEQWALPAIGAPSAWADLPADAAKVTVAVIDSGICASHPDLAGRILDGWDFLESDSIPQDDFGHGCSVSGVIAANMNDGVGIAGVAPNAQIMPLRVLNASGVGSYSDVAAAIVYAADNGAQVINLSLGGSNPSSTLENAVNYAISKGVIVVAAAGNSGTEGALYPGAYPDVIAVGSVDPNLQHSSFSNYGSQIDIWAPGRDILTTKRDGSYGLVSGTSFAAPYVAGAIVIYDTYNQQLAIDGSVLSFNTNNGGIVVLTETSIETTPTSQPIPTDVVMTPPSPDVENLAVDLSSGMPPVGDQGDQASCVGWALAYYYKSYQEKIEHNWGYSNDTLFSPSYIFNQFAISNINSGLPTMEPALQLLVDQGVAPLALFPYNDQVWQTQPSASVRSAAISYKAKSYQMMQNLSLSDLTVLKNHLASGDPFVMDIPLYYDIQLSGWDIQLKTIPTVIDIPSASNLFQVGGYRHAITVVGYDDTLQRFKFVNSWGTGWGVGGYGYITYGYVIEMGTNAYFMVDQLDSTNPPSIDITPPTGVWSSISNGQTISSSNVNLIVNASDNSGGSGVREVRWSAKWGGNWYNLGVDTSSPYSMSWNMCNSGVPNGDVELGFEIWDNANNKWVYSEHYTNYHINKNYACNQSSNDTTPPTVSWSSPGNGSTINSRSVTLIANASDNSGGSGVREVRWSALFNGQWSGIGTDTTYPYSLDWDMCNSGVPNGDIELGMEVWDNANNVWIYSQHYANYHINKSFDCGGNNGGGDPLAGGPWNTQAWMNKYMAGYANWEGTYTWNNGYPYIWFDWGSGGTNLPGFGSDEFSMRMWRSVYFPGGYYSFMSQHDDGIKVYLDGNLIIDAWWDGSGGHDAGRNVSAGYHEVKVEYYESQGDAKLQLVWYGPGYPAPDNNPPDGKISTPANNSASNASTLNISADAWDDASGVDRVDFYAYYCQSTCDTHFLGSDYTSPYTYNWDWSGLSDTRVWLRIDVQDKTGKWRTIAGDYVIIDRDRVNPTASITSPLANTYLSTNQITINASANDDRSGVQKIQFFAGYNEIVGAGAQGEIDPPLPALPGDSRAESSDVASQDYWHEIGWDENGADGWSFTWNAASVPDQGGVALFIYAYDKAGNYRGVQVWPVSLDRVLPTSAINALSMYTSSTSIAVNWTGSDVTSGIANYDIQYQDNGGAWTNWLSGTTLTSSTFTGTIGHTYAFRSRAHDRAGSVEDWPTSADAQTTLVTVPANNNFGSALVIGTVPYNHAVDTRGATTAPDDPTSTCGYGKNSNSVWYRYTAPANGILEIGTYSSNFDTVIAVWRGTQGNLTLVGCNDDSFGSLESWLEEISVTSNTTYYIEIMDYGNPGGGNLQLYVGFARSVANNDFNTPTVITSTTYNVSLDARGATKSNDDPTLTSCNRLPGQASVWYRYSPAVDGSMAFDTKGSNYDTMLAVWKGTRGNLTSLGCNDDIGDVNGVWDSDSILTVRVKAGTIYYIEVATYNGKIDVDGASTLELLGKSEPDDIASLEDIKILVENEHGVLSELQAGDSSPQFWGGTLQLHMVYTQDPVLPTAWVGSVSIESDKNIVAVGRPHIGSEIASYNGFPAGDLISYIPMLFKDAFGGSYDAAFYIQNVNSTSAANVTIQYYDSAGGLTCTKNDIVAPFASKGYWVPSEACLPTSWVGGVVVTSDQPIVTLGRPHIGSEVMTYNGFSSGFLSSSIPMLFKDAFGGSYDAAFYIQNVEPTTTANLTIQFYDSMGVLSCTKNDTLAPLASKGYWVPAESCLPTGWVGGVVVTSDQPIVAVGRPHIGSQITTYNGFSSGTLSSYVPMLFKDAFGGSYDSAFYIQNTGTTDIANLTIRFYDSAGNLSCSKSDILAPLASKGYWMPAESCLPVGWSGGIVVTSDQPIVAVGRPHIGAQITTYNGFASGSTSSFLSMLFKDAFGGSYDAAFYIQNTDATEATVTTKFYDNTGALTCIRTDLVPALSTLGVWVPSVSCTP